MLRLLLLAPVLCACYRYTPIEPATVQRGTEVRARVSAALAEQFAPLLGTTDARLLVGTVLSNESDTLLMEVPTSSRVAAAGGFQQLNQRLRIPRGALLELEERSFSQRRTTVVIGAAALVVGSILVKTLVLDPGKERIPTDPGGTEFRPR
jgi:hypothetical protein